jgi:hypothetical protein
MDEDLIKLVNKLQDTFSNLGARTRLTCIASLSTHCSTLTPPRAMRGLLQVGSWTCPSWLWYAGFVPDWSCLWNLFFVGWQPIRRQIQCARKVSVNQRPLHSPPSPPSLPKLHRY